MFRNPFSFTGRIRRLEYGLSQIIFMAGIFIIGISSEMFGLDENPLIIIYMVTGYWFMFAQGFKRCQDMGQNGFLQFIPFYGFVMLFAEGERGINNYGSDPKDDSQPSSIPPFKLKTELPDDKSWLAILNEMLCIALLNIFCLVVLINYSPSEFFSFLAMLASFIGCYFLLLLLSNSKKPLPDLPPYWFRHRWLYAIMVYTGFFTYKLIFEFETVSLEKISHAFCFTLFMLVVTYIPFAMYKNQYKQRKEVVLYEE